MASWTDLRRRRIPNMICIIVAVGAVPFWIGVTNGRLGDAWQSLPIFAIGCLILFPLWAWRILGGGDVKLMAALLLWQDMDTLPTMLIVMALSGGVQGIVLLLMRQARMRWRKLTVPYGFAISLGAATSLWPVTVSLAG